MLSVPSSRTIASPSTTGGPAAVAGSAAAVSSSSPTATPPRRARLAVDRETPAQIEDALAYPPFDRLIARSTLRQAVVALNDHWGRKDERLKEIRAARRALNR